MNARHAIAQAREQIAATHPATAALLRQAEADVMKLETEHDRQKFDLARARKALADVAYASRNYVTQIQP